MKQLTMITRGYASAANRQRAISALRKHGKNYFVLYRDTAAEHALQFMHADWVDHDMGKGAAYICR